MFLATGQFYQVIKLSTKIITLVEVSIAHAEDWKIETFIHLITIGWVHIKQRGIERQRERGGVHNKSE